MMRLARLLSAAAICLVSPGVVAGQSAALSTPRAMTAAAQTKAESWFRSAELAEGVWRIDDNGSDNMYLVEGKDKALLIDTGLGAATLAEYVKTLTTKPLLVVNTHGHPDHAGGNYQFKAVYAHPADFGAARQVATPEARARAMQAMAKGKTAPDMVTAEDVSKAKEAELLPVNDGFVFDLGGRKLEVIETPGHTAGEIVLLDAANKQVFTGDNDNVLVWLFLPTSLPLEVYLESLKKLEQRGADFNTLYPGHGTPLPAAFVSEQVKCVESILDGSCQGEPYKSFAGNAVTCKHGSAVVAFDPKNLRARK